MEAALTAALPRIQFDTGIDVAFGGFVGRDGTSFAISRTIGGISRALDGLVINTGEGLGGMVMAQKRPASVTDYLSTPHITHRYDPAVSSEQLRSIVAVPVLVHSSVRAVLYGGLRMSTRIGSNVVEAIERVAAGVAFNLAVAEEVAKRLRAVETAAITRQAREPSKNPEWESVRVAHAELRELALRVDDADVKDRIKGILAQLNQPTTVEGPRLTEREIDVLALVAIGETNAGIGTRLGLRPETVKSYLRNAMRKLDAHGRVDAVVRARRFGILP